MSHYKPYPAYKDSGVQWLGKVPEHWERYKLKHIFKEKKNFSNPELPAGAISFGNVIEKNSENLAPDTRATYQEVLPGEFLVNPINLNYDLKSLRTALSRLAVCVSPAYIVLTPKQKQCNEYLEYLLHHFDVAHMKTLGAGVRQTITFSDIGACECLLPPIDEQTIIAKYLNRETDRLDALIIKKIRFIELLREKRQALITQAVTKGVNANAKMRISEVEWLGEVPEHWSIKALKYVATPIIGLTYSPDDVVEESSGTLVLRSSNIQDGMIVLDDNVYVSTVIPDHLRTRIGDIVICSRNGSRSLIGKNGMVNKHSEGQTFGAFTTVVRSPINDYLHLILNSALFKYQSGRFLTTTINQLTTETLKSFEIPLPPRDEQLQIIDWIKSKISRFDEIIRKTEQSIESLKERRSAIITAAITGQIDLQNQLP